MTRVHIMLLYLFFIYPPENCSSINVWDTAAVKKLDLSK